MSKYVESRVRDEAMGQVQALIEAAVGSSDNITLAKSNAEKTLQRAHVSVWRGSLFSSGALRVGRGAMFVCF